MQMMKAAVYVERGRIVLDEKPIPAVGPLDALMRITTTTICGTDVHILKGEYPVRAGPAMNRLESSNGSAPRSPASRRASGSSQAPLLHPAIPRRACAVASARTARARNMDSRQSAAGSSATRSTALRRNTCWCRTRWPISPRCRTG